MSRRSSEAVWWRGPAFWLGLAAGVLVTACVRVNVHGTRPGPEPLRVATYNTSLYDDVSGRLINRLEAGDEPARRIAAVLQRVRPDIVLLNEFDFDPAHRAADLFQRHYLEVAQSGGGRPLHYPYRFLAPVNTGVPSGLDLDRSGSLPGVDAGADDPAEAARKRGNNAWGYGLHPGQYGMLVLSRFPIDANAVRTFQRLRWSTLPGAHAPVDPETGQPWYPPHVWSQLRLSSKSHWDVPVHTPQGVLHLLAAHPTPPVFDGPENRNGLRNFDEIGLWKRYLDGGSSKWLCDDRGRCGGLSPDAAFVIAGDYNADPTDGEGEPGAIAQLVAHPRVNGSVVPRSAGAPERASAHSLPRRGDTAAHTGDFGPRTGTLRLDYVLPSRELRVHDAGVFWPPADSPDAALAGASDHRAVWIDVTLPATD
ncbi:endonuclease [Lysobacter bugurensis]|uniref:Endonuclease n=1 Tax=Cognatilysobacter bugurensis TaxID=543356 RepID=A0A918ST11_9GAMM|nr:endonuclease [Lysobacter bugurensis]